MLANLVKLQLDHYGKMLFQYRPTGGQQMKYLIVLAGLVAFNAQSEDLTMQQVNAMCDAVGSASERIMKARQNGVAKSELVASVQGSSADDSFKEQASAMIDEAYSQPIYPDGEVKSNATQGFRSKHFLQCHKEGRERLGGTLIMPHQNTD